MTAVRFNSLGYSAHLKELGVDPKVADFQAKELEIALDNVIKVHNIATKYDLEKSIDNLHLCLTKEINSMVWKIIGGIGALQTILHFIKF